MKNILIFCLFYFFFFTNRSQAQSWSQVGAINDTFSCLSITNDAMGNVYVAGYFANSSGNRYVAKWNGTNWSEVGGLNGLAANDLIWNICSNAAGNIYAAGGFTNSNGKMYVAKWDGTNWNEVGGLNGLSANNQINAVCYDASGNIYAAGFFTNSNGKMYVAKWNGANWSELGGANGLSANQGISSVCSDASGNIYAAGNFTNSTGKYYVAKWNGNNWSELGGANALSANGMINSVCSDASGNIYAAGNFSNSNGNKYIAKWNGTNWSELGGVNALSANNFIYSVCSDVVGNIYAAGYFTNSNGQYYVAEWNGSTWSELGGANALAANNYIFGICNNGTGNIYACGLFRNSIGPYVAKYSSSCFATSSSINQSICAGSSVLFNGQNISVNGTYKDTLTNYLGCDSVITLNLIVNPSPTISFTTEYQSCFNPTFCAAINMTATNGVAPYTFNVNTVHGGVYNSINKTICWSVPLQDTITIMVTDANGCTASSTDTIKLSTDCVWPGDANSDLVADNLDIFPIGLLNGTTGPVRNNASLVWIDQPATPFGTSASGFTIDAKHADCNGDGIIDGNDTTAILQNYGLTHLRKKSGADLMTLTVGPDTLYQNTTATIHIGLGTAALPIDSVYGVAFSFNVDPTAIDTNSISITAPSSWLFNNPTDHFQIYKLSKSATRVDVGLVRNNHISKSGFGDVVTVTIDITTGNIIGREDALAAYNKKYQLHCSVDNVTILKVDGSMISANVVADSSIVLYNKPNGINNVSIQNLSQSIIPNPATNNVSIKLKGYNYNEEKKLILIDATGRLMLQKTFTSNQTTIDISELNQGIYIAKIISEKGITESKLIKQ